MIALPTASKLHDAATCPASAVLPVIPSVHPAGDTGHDRHELLVTALEYVRAGKTLEVANPVEQRWLDAVFEHPFTAELTGYAPEVAYGYDVETGQAWCWGRIPARQYPEHAPTTICGTADYVLADEECVWIVDVKTGRTDVPPPHRNLQLKALALAAAKFHGVFTAKTAILHATADGDAVWVEHGPVWQLADLMEIGEEFRALYAELNAPQPRVTPGPHCRLCDAYTNCPATKAMVRVWLEPTAADNLVSTLGMDTAANFYRVVQTLRGHLKRAEQALYAWGNHNTIHLGGDEFFGQHTTEKEVFTPESYGLLAAELGAWKALEAFDLETSKTAILRTVAKYTKRGAKKERGLEVLEKVRAAGAVRTKSSTTIGEFTKRAAPALPAPGVASPPTAPEPVLSAGPKDPDPPPLGDEEEEDGLDEADIDPAMQHWHNENVGCR